MPENYDRFKYVLSVDFWKSWWVSPDFRDNQSFKDYDKWCLDFVPGEKSELYPSILDHAYKSYERTLKLTETLDKKADDLIRTASAIIAIMAATTKLGAGHNTYLFLPTLLCLTISVITATRGRGMLRLAMPISVRDLINAGEHFTIQTKEQLNQVTASSYQCAIIGLQITNQWKALQIKRANSLFCIAILLVALNYI